MSNVRNEIKAQIVIQHIMPIQKTMITSFYSYNFHVL